MKKLTALFLTLVMALGLTGCGGELTDAALDLAIDMMTESEEYQDSLDAIGGQDGDPAYFYAVTDGEEDGGELPDYTDNTAAPEDDQSTDDTPFTTNHVDLIDEDGWYYSKEDVSLYLVTYGCLPSNFITKDEARDLGWTGGSVEDYAPGYAIGGDVFGNYEGLLPKASGRTYYECDIDTDGYGSRGSRRIVFSDDGLIYYTGDHYESFTLLYGEE